MNTATALPPLKKSSKAVWVILGVCALALAFFIVGGIALFRTISGVSTQAAVPAGRFLDALQAHDYRMAYGMLAPQAQANTSASSIRDIQELLEKRHGRAVGHSAPASWNVNSYNGVTSVQLSYLERFQQGQVPVVLVLTRTPDGWRIVSYNFQL